MKASEFITEHEMVWSRSGSNIKLKYRCSAGQKKGRIVPDQSACDAPVDVKKRAQMKQTRANTKIRQAKKAKKTKRVNPASKLLSMLNKFKKGAGHSSSKSSKVAKAQSSSTKKAKSAVKPKKLKK